MPHIAIISASVRVERASHRVALYFNNLLKEQHQATAEILDLEVYQFPLFNERLSHQKDPSPAVLEFTDRVVKADGIIIVTPEYNGGYPASLKNVIDLLYNEWYKKPISVATVSEGAFAGTQVITSLLFTLWKIRAWVVPPAFPVPTVNDMFNERGEPANKAAIDKRANGFLKELLWAIDAKQRMQAH